MGDGASTRTAFAVGAMYHVSNGIGLGVAYRLLVPRPTWKNGILWAFGLELAMALLFPRWLRMTALAEFFTVSVVGHAVYGVVLAWACRRMASRRRARSRPARAQAG